MRNYRRFSETIGTAGQPTAEELADVAADGYQVVVNIATVSSESSLQSEDLIVKDLGMDYYSIPVVWDEPKHSDFDSFLMLMNSLEGKKIFVHCAANYRVTAFISLYGMARLGLSKDDADEFIGSVWEPSEYPVWAKFIEEIRQRIN